MANCSGPGVDGRGTLREEVGILLRDNAAISTVQALALMHARGGPSQRRGSRQAKM